MIIGEYHSNQKRRQSPSPQAKRLTHQTSMMSSLEKSHQAKPMLSNRSRQVKTLMSDREEQWFLMDKRLLFASDDERIA